MGGWGQQVCAATHRTMTQKALLEEGQGGRLGSAGVFSNTQDDDQEGPAGNYTQRLTINHNGREGVCMCNSAPGLQSRNEHSTGN